MLLEPYSGTPIERTRITRRSSSHVKFAGFRRTPNKDNEVKLRLMRPVIPRRPASTDDTLLGSHDSTMAQIRQEPNSARDYVILCFPWEVFPRLSQGNDVEIPFPSSYLIPLLQLSCENNARQLSLCPFAPRIRNRTFHSPFSLLLFPFSPFPVLVIFNGFC